MQQANVAYNLDKTFEGERSDYLKEINAKMEELSGVRYLDVYKSLHLTFEAYKDAFDRGVPALAFVNDTMRDFGFLTVGKIYDREYAAGYNNIKAAMAEYATVDGEWKMGRDGSLYHETDAGVAIMNPVRNFSTDRWAFGIQMREGATLDILQTQVVTGGKVTGVYGHLDLGPAVDAYKIAHVESKKFGF